MLSEESYLIAIYIYTGAASLFLLYLAWWLSRHWRPGWVALVVLLAAALLLTPAYPREGIDTMAPALVVVSFQVFNVGIDAAQHALRPLVFFSGMALVGALLLQLTIFRGRGARKASSGRRVAKN